MSDTRLDDIYREIRPDLLRYFQQRHGSAETAEDLLQETFAAVMKNPLRLLAADSSRAYLFGIARNISVEALRRGRPTQELNDHDAPDLEVEDPRLAAMRDAIGNLNPVLREVLELRLRDELSYDEIAQTLGIPVGTVRSRLHHAVRKLSEAMKKTEDL